MKLIIPMTGKGQRFLKAGYSVPKSLLRVDGKYIIEHILDSFPGEEDILFVCHPEHLETTEMETILKSLRPRSTIVVSDGTRLGPVYALTEAFGHISDSEPVMVSYCDYGQVWDYEQFKKDVKRLDCDAAIPSYTGFHPHLLRKNLYAGVLINEDRCAIAIQEKHCFTQNPEDSFHSVGTHYFKTGSLLKQYCRELIEKDLRVNNEYYVSMVHELMLNANHTIFVPTLTHFMQWGTPEDLEEYEAWSRRLHDDLQKEKGQTDIPESRESFVKIPYAEDTPEFERSYKYWAKYFSIK